MPRKRKPRFINDPLKGMCETHHPIFEWLTEEEVNERHAEGKRQEQCKHCMRWLWPHERGDNFVSTGRLDTD